MSDSEGVRSDPPTAAYERRPGWCTKHNDFAWRYDDDSVQCFVSDRSLAYQEHLQREVIRLFTDELAAGYGHPDVVTGLRAAGSLLWRVGQEWRHLIDEWEFHHDMLIVGVPL